MQILPKMEHQARHLYANARYMQTNGQAESSDKIIVNNIKKRIDEVHGRWAAEFLMILWVDKTTPKMQLTKLHTL